MSFHVFNDTTTELFQDGGEGGIQNNFQFAFVLLYSKFNAFWKNRFSCTLWKFKGMTLYNSPVFTHHAQTEVYMLSICNDVFKIWVSR